MIRRVAILLTLLVVAAACSNDRTTVDVFAASSLTDAFSQLETRFEQANPTVDIRLILGGSDTLRRQIDDGADADVFAPADESLLDGLTVDGGVINARPYATNQVEMIANSGVRTDGRDLFDWTQEGVVVARCEEGVPCGMATDVLLAEIPVRLGVVTFEPNVREVLTKVRLGEADAGFVYRTDRLSAGDDVVDLGITSASASVRLAVAALSDRTEAIAFADFVLSDEAAAVLQDLGFGRP